MFAINTNNISNFDLTEKLFHFKSTIDQFNLELAK